MFSRIVYKPKFIPAIFILISVIICAPAIAKETTYHVETKKNLPGDIKWDYLAYDPDGHNLFITHGDNVDIYNTAKNKIIGHITKTRGVHGVAISSEFNHGYTSNGTDNKITVFNLSSLKTITTIKTGKEPDSIVYDPFSKSVFVTHPENNSLSVISAKTNKNTGSVELGGKPEFAVTDGKGLLFINIKDKNQIVVLDVQHLKITARYDITSVCNEPKGLSINPANEHLFVSCNKNLSVVDASNNGKILATLAIGKSSDATVYDEVSDLAFSSNADGTLTVIGKVGKNKYGIRQIVKTMPGARTMALDPISHKIYLVSAEMNRPAKGAEEHNATMKEGTFTLLTVAP